MRSLPPLPTLPDKRTWYLSGEEVVRLDAAGHPAPKLADDPRNCEVCRGRGTFRFYAHAQLGPRESGQEVVDYECPCREQALLDRWFLAHGIEHRLAVYYLGDLWHVEEQAQLAFYEYLAKLERYLDHGRGLLLWGKKGNGKTLMTSLVLKRCAEIGRSVYHATFTQLLDLHTAGFGSAAEKARFDRQVRTADVLAIDDIGREHDKRSIARSALDHVLRTRVQAGLTTLVSTNLSPEELTVLYDDAIASLLVEACAAHYLGNEDWRGPYSDLKQYEINEGITRPVTFGIF